MGIMRGHWTWNDWCVLAMVTDVAPSYTLTGWLSMLRRGFLHRDISIGNVLMFDPPVTMKPFEALPIEQLTAQLSLGDAGELRKYADLLENVIGKMDFSDKCHGFVIDGDIAASLEGYFTSRDTGERSVGIPSCAGRSN